MAVKLYDGCYGVTHGAEVVGPYNTCGLRGQLLAHTIVWTNENIIRIFPTREAAEAWVNRKPWYRSRLVKAFWPMPLGDWIALIGAILFAWILFGCTSPTAPAVTCKTQGWDDSAKAWVWVPCDTIARVGHNASDGKE